MGLLGSAAHAVLHPVQFADHIGDAVWHEVAKKMLGGVPTNDELYGRPFTADELRSSQRKVS
jgi:hypothetical protein